MIILSRGIIVYENRFYSVITFIDPKRIIDEVTQ